jgi:hypothetical protein
MLEDQGVPFFLIALFSAGHSLGMVGEYERDEVYEVELPIAIYANQSLICLRVFGTLAHT